MTENLNTANSRTKKVTHKKFSTTQKFCQKKSYNKKKVNSDLIKFKMQNLFPINKLAMFFPLFMPAKSRGKIGEHLARK